MEKATIGAILKNRIKQQGYTQETFAEKVGIGLATLKNYLNGKRAYTYDWLVVFSKELDCCVEYLLGISKSPIREYAEISNTLRLSDNAISKIEKYANEYENMLNRFYIYTLNALIEDEDFIQTIRNFFISSKYQQNVVQTIFELAGRENPFDTSISNETMQVIDIQNKLKDIKFIVNPIMTNEMKESNLTEVIDQVESVIESQSTDL